MYATTMTNYKKKFTLGTCTILNINYNIVYNYHFYLP